MSDFIEMEVEVVEGLESEVSHLARQIKTLADFLTANFQGEVSPEDDIFGEGAIKIAVRLLSELKVRRQDVQIEGRLLDELDAAMRRNRVLEMAQPAQGPQPAQGQRLVLAKFLMAEFENEVKGDYAIGVAIHLLGELKERRRQVETLRAELVTARREIEKKLT